MRLRPLGAGSGLPTQRDGNRRYTNPYANCDSNRYFYSYAYRNSNTYCNSNTYAYCYTYSDAKTVTDAETVVNAEAASHAAAAPVTDDVVSAFTITLTT